MSIDRAVKWGCPFWIASLAIDLLMENGLRAAHDLTAAPLVTTSEMRQDETRRGKKSCSPSFPTLHPAGPFSEKFIALANCNRKHYFSSPDDGPVERLMFAMTFSSLSPAPAHRWPCNWPCPAAVFPLFLLHLLRRPWPRARFHAERIDALPPGVCIWRRSMEDRHRARPLIPAARWLTILQCRLMRSLNDAPRWAATNSLAFSDAGTQRCRYARGSWINFSRRKSRVFYSRHYYVRNIRRSILNKSKNELPDALSHATNNGRAVSRTLIFVCIMTREKGYSFSRDSASGINRPKTRSTVSRET